jgi:L-ribulose-5-phosphate 4-epimerase
MGGARSLGSLREEAFEANRDIPRMGLAIQTWGNASAFDPGRGLMAIKPSGVAYADLKPSSMVVMDMEGLLVSGSLRPSSDAPTHIALYRAFAARGIRGLVHTHSRYATAWAQARMDIPLLGTTHADNSPVDVPCVRMPDPEESALDYEAVTGRIIIGAFAERGIDPVACPMVLVAGHGPFAWGESARAALLAASALEEIAAMAFIARSVSTDPSLDGMRLPAHIIRKHQGRKHGPGAYYGQGRA